MSKRRKPTERCRNCGQKHEIACAFVPVMVPDSCVCDVDVYAPAFDIKDVCAAFVPDTDPWFDGGVCATCQHDKACHDEPVMSERRER